MATTLRTTFQTVLQMVFATDFGQVPISLGEAISWAHGTAVDQANLGYATVLTIASTGAPQTIDLSGTLVMVDGSAAVFAKIKAVYFRHLGTVTTDDANIVEIGGGSNPFINWLGGTAPVLKLPNRGEWMAKNPTSAGWAVTAGTGDLLKFTSLAGTNVRVAVGLVGTA